MIIKSEITIDSNRNLKTNPGQFAHPHSKQMEDTINIARRVAQGSKSVFITGESGVGKGLMARFIHDLSGRAEKPFVTVSCAMLTERFLYGEPFGYVNNYSAGRGLWGSAAGGTILLDEVGDLSPDMRVKILRFLRKSERPHIRADKTWPADVRIIATTNQNLTGDVVTDQFLHELNGCLHGIKLPIPPLRNRQDDILPLARYFLEKASYNQNQPVVRFSKGTASLLLRYQWPGNVRELQNALSYATTICRKGVISYRDLPANLNNSLSVKSSKTDSEIAQNNNECYATACAQIAPQHSKQMEEVINITRRIAQGNKSVFMTGESGVGKGFIARFIHDQSGHPDKPFVSVNCAVLTEELLYGSPPDVSTPEQGLWEVAAGGTIFLDEVGDLSSDMQIMLLRFLRGAAKKYIGVNKTSLADVRIIAATSRNLAEDIAIGYFLYELKKRLHGVELHIPPLRDRRDDILPLARYFLEEASHNRKTPITRFSKNAANILSRHDWPGNVRELQNTLNYAATICRKNVISCRDLPEGLRSTLLADSSAITADINRNGPITEKQVLVREHAASTI